MLINELNYNGLLKALENYKKSSYYAYYNSNKSIIEAIEEDRVFFNESGKIIGEYRICSECGRIMVDGYLIGDGDEYYCSDECLHKHYTQEEYLEMYENDDAFWTAWY